MKFSDMVIAVAAMGVVAALIGGLLDLAFVSALGLVVGYPVSFIVYMFIAALVGGYVFAGKIQEARKEAIAKITVLWGAFWIILATIVPAQAEWGAYVRQAYQGQYGATLTIAEWVNWESVFLEIFALETIIIVVVTSIIGLYIGSMLRKPKTN